jgi:hypothetical protein
MGLFCFAGPNSREIFVSLTSKFYEAKEETDFECFDGEYRACCVIWTLVLLGIENGGVGLATLVKEIYCLWELSMGLDT